VASLTIDVDGAGRPPLFLSVSVHVARRNHVAEGEAVAVSLLAEGIQLMPPDRERTPIRRPEVEAGTRGNMLSEPAG
jgi:hypothetical protein